ncbi:hypothetical protein BDV96DRAFT_598297 [Lophiotrema nucula]|uniref:Uncharacterized protein n=1 Tax=Lophiotrema nucula TaxID=690887 RepID=A0A6A5ZD04_9PLEO|nr:hypothetical protein BDV96DRAFT_598297 [Lophiotrema nucula]
MFSTCTTSTKVNIFYDNLLYIFITMPRATRKNTKAFDALFGKGVTIEQDPNRKKGNRIVKRKMPKKGTAECKALVPNKPNIWKRMLGAQTVPNIDMHNQPWQHDPALAHVPGNFNQGLMPSGPVAAGRGNGENVGAGNRQGGGFPNPLLNNNGGVDGPGGFVNPPINSGGAGSQQNFNPLQNMANPHANQGGRGGPSGSFPASPTLISNHGAHAHQSELARANTLGGQTHAGQPLRGLQNQGTTTAVGSDGPSGSADSSASRERYTSEESTNARSRQEEQGPGTLPEVPTAESAHEQGVRSHRFPYSRPTPNASIVARSRQEIEGLGTVLYVPESQRSQHQEHRVPSQHTRTSRASTAVGGRLDQEYSVHPLIPTASNAPHHNNMQTQHTQTSLASTAVGQRSNREYTVHNPMDNLTQAMGQLSVIHEGNRMPYSHAPSNARMTHLQPRSAATQRWNAYAASQAPTMFSQNVALASPSEMARVDAMHGATQMGYPLRGYEDEVGGSSRRTRRTRGSRRSHRSHR